MVNPTRIWKLKLENKDILFVAFQQKKIQSLWVLIYSVLLLTLFSGNSWNTWWDLRHVRASSWCHILTLVIVFFLLFINSEEFIYFQNFWGTLFESSNSVYINIYNWSWCYKICGYCNLWAHLRVRYVVSIWNLVVLSGFYPTDCQIIPFEVRISYFFYNS